MTDAAETPQGARLTAKQVAVLMDLMSIISHVTTMQMVNHPNTQAAMQHLAAVQNAFLGEFLDDDEKQKLIEIAREAAAQKGIVTPPKPSIIIPGRS